MSALVGVIMGSDSDWPVMSAAAEALADHPDVTVAAVNAPGSVVLSGPTEALTTLRDGFREQNVRARFLTVSHAFHSPLMEPMLDDFARVVADPGRHLALLLLLRIVGEMAAAACITVVFVHAYGAGFAAVGLGTVGAAAGMALGTVGSVSSHPGHGHHRDSGAHGVGPGLRPER